MSSVTDIFALAWQNLQAGNFAHAEHLLRQCLLLNPAHPHAHNALAITLVRQGKLDEAAANLQAALRLQPYNAETHNNLGSVLTRLGRTAQAVDSFRQAICLKSDFAQAHYNLGLALKTLAQRDAAMAAFHEALRLQPDLAPAFHDLGDLFAEKGQLSDAESHYRQALRLHPERADTLHNLGCVLQNQGRLDEALISYQQALKLLPSFARGHYNLGTALHAEGRLREAEASYRHALALLPDYVEAHNNLGLVLREQGKLDEAIACHRQALRLRPQSAQVHINLAGAFRENGLPLEAITAYQAALQLEPANSAVLAELTHQLQQACLWKNLDGLSEQVIAAIQNDSPGNHDAISPFTFLSLPTPTTPQDQYQCARRWVNRRISSPSDVRCPMSDVKNLACLTSDIGLRTSDRITIGYLSADFHEHATAYLIAELIERHDRRHFSVFAYSYGPDDASPMRHRLVKAFDRFRDVRSASFQQAAQLVVADGVDILIDLKGHTRFARTEIMSLRPAPIQVHYLGYPGTMAAPFIDYILVDDFVVPPQQQPFFTEKLVHLPGCYQVNDSQRPIGPHTPSRTACGLPESAFVFSCFNNSYKITPQMFAAWMRLLLAVPGSVLWLLEDNPTAAANLRAEAQARGVAPDRLVFAPRRPMADHLARHRLADLFLDTVPYNAHTTASDALWVGCPVLTIAGQTFPSRVAGSLLRTIGLPELITSNLAEYEAMALRLARDVEFLASLRSRLAANRSSSGLFDGQRYARDLEKAFRKMWQLHTSGEQPRAFSVSGAGSSVATVGRPN
jgi:protein O-GlcNAc transferase